MSSGTTKLRVPCSVISVDSPKRREFLTEGLPKQRHENILGHGSYGTVVKAVYKGKQVAMKIIDNLDVKKMSTIANEANILEWHHENIIQILKVDTGPREAVIIMERFPGQCLQHILERRKLPLYHAIRTAMDITKGLAYCHDRKLLHLDIKPRNVLVAIHKSENSNERTYQCKLCDFGSSMFVSNIAPPYSTKGTIRYMAPELLKNGKATTQADIYSLGITMWQLKTGRDPYFWISENQAVIYKVVKENLRPDQQVSYRAKQFLSPTAIGKCLCEHFGSNTDSSKSATPTRKLGCTASPVLGRQRYQSRNIDSKFDMLIGHSTFSRSPARRNCSPYKGSSKSPIKDLAPPSSCSRGLQFSPRSNVTIQVNSMVIDENFDLDYAFQEKKSTKMGREVLLKYEGLYRDCWDLLLEKRPDALTVVDRLNELLKCF